MANLDGTGGNDILNGTDESDVIRGLAGDDAIDAGGGDDTVEGGDGDDELRGGEGNDVLDGGTGVNLLDGGPGNDELNLGLSTDVWPDFSIAAGGSGRDVIWGSEGRDEIYSDLQEDPYRGYSSFNPNFPDSYHAPTLDRGTDPDTVYAGAGDDFVSIGYGDSANGGTHGEHGDTLFLSLAGSPTGITANFTLTTLMIGGGTITEFESVDYLEGSEFNDVFTFSADPYPGEGFGMFGGGTEISGLGGDDRITGGYYTNNIWGGDGNDILDGRASQYLMFLDGGAGNDTLLGADNVIAELRGGEGNDSVTGGDRWDKIFGGEGNDTLRGLEADDYLDGGAGDDTLDGGAGLDQMYGGAGDDTYIVADATDKAYEFSDEGYDRVVASISFTLLDEIEELTLTGSASVAAFGNDLANVITGNAGSNTLVGLDGNDRLRGGSGNDLLEGGSGDDRIDGGAGIDTASYAAAAAAVTVDLSITGVQNTLGAGVDTLVSVERLLGSSHGDTLTGTSGSDMIGGEDGDDHLYGNAGNDTLSAGAGIDRLYGGIGNDTYIVSDATDYAYEYAGEGNDTVLASVSHVLRDNLEALTLTGTASIRGIGNAGANTITGNSGSNRLYGRDGDDRLFGAGGNDRFYGEAGVDRMYGGAGNDIYIVHDATDHAFEYAGEGYDRVYSTVSFVLHANVEMLRLQGSSAINGYGGDDANIIYGNVAANKLNGWGGDDRLFGEAGNDRLYGTEGNDRLFGGDGEDRLDGGAGYDRLYGGAGDDTYIVHDSTDYAYEDAGDGVDRVYSTITHVLRANVEELYLQGSAAIRGYGSDEANTIVGNSAANRLYGQGGDDRLYGRHGDDRLYGHDGDDRLDGGRGMDLLYGGTGGDTFLFRSGDFASAVPAGADRILDFSQAENDHIHLSSVDADTGLGGTQSFDFIGTGDFTGTAGELRYEQLSGSTYVSGDTNGDGVADFMIRIDGLHTLESGDFIL